MKVLSLYCGAGGMDEGLRQAGIKTTLAIDSWNDACVTFKENHPEAEVINKTVGEMKESLGNFDLVIGGPPCPEFSPAKTNRSFDACEVNNFWDIVEKTKAKYWIMENVPDVIRVCKKKNYVVNTADYGVPQTRRRRIFTTLPLPKPTHSEFPTNTLFGEPMKKWISVKDALGLDGFIEDRKITYGSDQYRKYSNEKPSHTITVDSRDFFIYNTGHGTQNRENITRSIDEPSDTITTASDVKLTNKEVKSVKKIRNRKPMMIQNREIFGWKKKKNLESIDRPSSTLLADGSGNGRWLGDGETFERKLENDEVAILQGFPKSYKFIGTKTSVRRQIGNAVPPPLIKAFGELICTA